MDGPKGATTRATMAPPYAGAHAGRSGGGPRPHPACEPPVRQKVKVGALRPLGHPGVSRRACNPGWLLCKLLHGLGITRLPTAQRIQGQLAAGHMTLHAAMCIRLDITSHAVACAACPRITGKRLKMKSPESP